MGADQRLDAEIGVTLGVAALPDPRFKVGANGKVRGLEADRVEAEPTVDMIGAVAAIDPVIARSGIDEVVARPSFDAVIAVSGEDIVVAGKGLDEVGHGGAADIVRTGRAGERAVVGRRDVSHGEAGVGRAFRVCNTVLDGDIAGEAGGKAHDDELLAGPVDDRSLANGVALPEREGIRVVDTIDADKGRARPVRVVEIVVDDAVTVVVGLLDVEVVGEEVADPKHQRRVERRDEAHILADGRIVVARHDDEIDIAFGPAVGVIGDAVDDTRAAGGVALRREDEIALIVELDRAVQFVGGVAAKSEDVEDRRIAPAEEPDRVSVDIGVIGEERRNRNDVRDVLVDIDRVAVRDRGRVADVLEPERDGPAVDGPLIVRDEIAEGGLAPIVGVRREDDRAVIGDLDVAMHGVAGALEANREALRIVIVLEKLDDRDLDRTVLEPAQNLQRRVGVLVVPRDRQIVHRLIDEGRTGPGAAAMTVVDLVFEPGVTVEVRRRREEHRAVFKKAGIAAMAVADSDDGHRIAVMLDIVGEQTVGANDDRIVLADRIAGIGRFEAIVVQIGRIVDRGDGEADARGRGRPVGIDDRVVEIGVAPEIGARGDMDQTVLADRDDDIGIGLHRLDRQPVTIDIGIVGQQRARIEREARPFRDRRCGLVVPNGCVVHRRDLDHHLGLGPTAFRRVRHIGEFGRAVEVGIWREGDIAVARERDRAVHGAIDLADDHAVAVEVVREKSLDANDEGGVLRDRKSGVGIGRGDGAHAQVDGRGGKAVVAVRHRVADRRRAVIAVRRGVADVALGVDRDRARIAGIHIDDGERVAVRIEVVAQNVRGLQDDLDAGRDGIEAVVERCRSAIAEQGPQRVLGPGDAI